MLNQRDNNIPYIGVENYNINFALMWFVNEIRLNWLFVKRDIIAIILPGLIVTASALHSHNFSLIERMPTLAQSTLYFWLYLTTCCIANQLVGVEEDRLNKPSRPLVSGMVSYKGAQIRFAFCLILIIATGASFGILEWTFLGVLCVILYDCLGLSRYWLIRNILVALAMLSMFAAAWQMVAPLTVTARKWMGVLAGAWLVLAHVSDLRDMEGDRMVGRKTFPLVFGELTSRILLSLGFGLLPFLVHFVLMAPAGNHFTVLLWDCILAIVSWSIAVRILICCTNQADHRTYMLFTGWHCLMLTSSFFVMS